MPVGKHLISVIVPVYKVEKYLDKCVRSIISQTYAELEIILVDDGSPDNCPRMCDEWAEKDSRIIVIHKENGGLSDARNAGMKAAKGEFIAFIDSDDFIAPQMLERLCEAMESDGSDIAACAVEMVTESGEPCGMLTGCGACVMERDEAQRELLFEGRLKQPVWYKLYRRETVKDIPFEKGKLHEDVFWSYQAVGNARLVSVIDYVGYYYVQRGGSIMNEGYSLRRLDAMEGKCRRYDYFKTRFPELEKRALYEIWNGCIYNGKMALRYLDKKERKKVFEALRDIQKAYPIKRSDYSDMKASHRVWIDISRVSLKAVCGIKNLLKIGY